MLSSWLFSPQKLRSSGLSRSLTFTGRLTLAPDVLILTRKPGETHLSGPPSPQPGCMRCTLGPASTWSILFCHLQSPTSKTWGGWTQGAFQQDSSSTCDSRVLLLWGRWENEGTLCSVRNWHRGKAPDTQYSPVMRDIH